MWHFLRQPFEILRAFSTAAHIPFSGLFSTIGFVRACRCGRVASFYFLRWLAPGLDLKIQTLFWRPDGVSPTIFPAFNAYNAYNGLTSTPLKHGSACVPEKGSALLRGSFCARHQ